MQYRCIEGVEGFCRVGEIWEKMPPEKGEERHYYIPVNRPILGSGKTFFRVWNDNLFEELK